MNAKSVLLSFFLAVSSIASASDTRHTPKPGSAERNSICDGARAYVLKEYISPKTKLPQPVVFKIERIEVIGEYCSFRAIPLSKDGSSMDTEYVMDIVFDLCLKRTKGAWQVVYDFSRTDVPTDDEFRQMWRKFPKDFPYALVPKFWRDHFDRVRRRQAP